ncbi:MAG: hypothetical protein KGL70_10720 [Betaproteobacteria bacterium]|nr:hypothetical protein [Betaproteobacteria bacterium]MDE2208387.1 hypothetical protein [Betaproteobacteria bacterium]MDE2359844.1 hypothetical protein [Betaproteobacteria bacterium]
MAGWTKQGQAAALRARRLGERRAYMALAADAHMTRRELASALRDAHSDTVGLGPLGDWIAREKVIHGLTDKVYGKAPAEPSPPIGEHSHK